MSPGRALLGCPARSRQGETLDLWGSVPVRLTDADAVDGRPDPAEVLHVVGEEHIGAGADGGGEVERVHGVELEVEPVAASTEADRSAGRHDDVAGAGHHREGC